MGNFEWKIWLGKWVKGLAVVLLSTGLLYTADYMELTEFPPEYAFGAGIVIIFLNQIGNWLKHK